jgi:thiaminase
MLILLLTFLGTYDWYPVEGVNASKEVLKSSIVQRFGKNRLRKSFIKLDAGIFKGGCMALVPEGYKIREVPEGLKFMINYIEVEKYDRYTAVYKSGKLEKEWNKLKRELTENIGGIHFGTPSLKELREELISENFIRLDSLSNRSRTEKKKDIRKPKKVYYSFLLVQKENDRKLIPVLLVLSPAGEIYKEIRREMSEEKGGEK